MVALSIPKLYTVDDLVALPNDNFRYELIRGELIQLPLRDCECSELGNTLASYASLFALEGKYGTCAMAGTGFLVARNPDTVIASDWAYVSRKRTFIERVCGYLPLAPDIVLEVRSPSDSPPRGCAQSSAMAGGGNAHRLGTESKNKSIGCSPRGRDAAAWPE